MLKRPNLKFIAATVLVVGGFFYVVNASVIFATISAIVAISGILAMRYCVRY